MGARGRARLRAAQLEKERRWWRRTEKKLDKPYVKLGAWLGAGGIVGAGFGAVTGELWTGVGAGVLGGITLYGRGRLERAWGKYTALIVLGLLWAGVLAGLDLLLTSNSTPAVWGLFGLMVPWLFAGTAALLRWVRQATWGAGKFLVRSTKPDNPTVALFHKPWTRDWAVWVTVGGVVVAAVSLVLGAGFALVFFAGGAGVVVASLRSIWVQLSRRH